MSTNRFNLQIADRDWLNVAAAECHYMHRPVHPRANPFGWALEFDGSIEMANAVDTRPVGFIMFSSIHYTKLRGEFGYLGLPTKWQVLQLSRLWIHPAFQKGGAWYSPDVLPGYIDRKGVFRSTLATRVIEWALGMVQRRWLEVHPPRFMNQPYHIRKVISYADNTYGHEGTIYKAATFREYGTTISRPRHSDTGDTGNISGNRLTCWIKDLPMPEFDFHAGMGLPLWEVA